MAEVARLHEQLDAETVTEHAGRLFRHGRLEGQRVTVVQSRIGKVAAAFLDQLASHYSYEILRRMFS